MDDDDPHLAEYQALGARVVVGERMGLGGTLNHYALEKASEYRVIGFLGDDHWPRTEGWEKLILDALPTTGMCYGNDLLQGIALPTAVFMTTDIIRALGWMSPPGLRHLFIDDAWRALGYGAECMTYLNDVIIEHVHPFANKAPMDEGYVEVNSTEISNADLNTWMEFQLNDLQSSIAAIRGLL